MNGAFHLDHRLAFVLLCGLELGAGIPLAIAWVRMLPEDAPPFESPGNTEQRGEEPLAGTSESAIKRGILTVAFLALVTLSYALQFPGVPREAVIQWLTTQFASQTAQWIAVAARPFFAFVPGLAACYSLLRKNFVRVPLIAASLLVLLLWLFGPYLEAALLKN